MGTPERIIPPAPELRRVLAAWLDEPLSKRNRRYVAHEGRLLCDRWLTTRTITAERISAWIARDPRSPYTVRASWLRVWCPLLRRAAVSEHVLEAVELPELPPLAHSLAGRIIRLDDIRRLELGGRLHRVLCCLWGLAIRPGELERTQTKHLRIAQGYFYTGQPRRKIPVFDETMWVCLARTLDTSRTWQLPEGHPDRGWRWSAWKESLQARQRALGVREWTMADLRRSRLTTWLALGHTLADVHEWAGFRALARTARYSVPAREIPLWLTDEKLCEEDCTYSPDELLAAPEPDEPHAPLGLDI